ncbi:uncharacterized protein C8Q71DRAFT_735660 [Rhodofomes roseus]|uniref:Autophagy-related protein 2 n=1 Tax=Rhodofomes roseus TaxID=34475 RepID=A0ABQ8KW20_9APHY|nr:uncharacterized protein C8Q71DRAFT_735660 [Rhodofomes roseus]KAH9843042.1 hypothetical protein C8Q71DRAFT_735660 [Rhodofomes roseus]
MSSWTSWIPSLPTIDLSLPSGIQRRFISFALKRSLGHLLKPGQLDLQQVDSQIGSGYVQIRDLELNNDAINSLISGLPLELHDGSIGKVTARIPWPNPLTSTIGLSVESPHLTFYLAPQSPDVTASHLDLAESVASVAESFIHEELNPADEATLRGSIHGGSRSPLQTGQDVFPGGLDPFVSDEELSQSELEPPGVSIFATLIEKLLARFAFDADDVKVTIVNPQQASFTLSIAQVRYGTETDPSVERTDASSREDSQGSIRGVTVSGITVTTRCLRPSSPVMTPTQERGAPSSRMTPTAAPASPQSPPTPPSPYSDSSDMDEETQMLMSQSIAILPPRPVSPATSVSSSMYQSAVSTAPVESSLHGTPSPEAQFSAASEPPAGDFTSSSESPPGAGFPQRPQPIACIPEVEDEIVASFGSDPISIRLYTPPPLSAHSPTPAVGIPSSSRIPSEGSKGSHRRSSSARTPDEKLRVTVDVGVIALALNARHVRSILDIADVWSLHSPLPARRTPSTSDGAPEPSAIPALDGTLRLRGIVLLLLPASSSSRALDARGSSEFFSRPLVPPKMTHGYVRAHMEELSTTAFISSSSSATPSRGESAQLHAHKRTSRSQKGTAVNLSVNLTLAELSVFAFLHQPVLGAPSPSTELYAYPVLITDPNLRSQYPRDHSNAPSADVHNSSMPSFDILDWTDPSRRSTAAKLSVWRSKAVQQHPTLRQETPGPKSSPRAQPGMPSSASPPTPRAMPRLLSTSPGHVGIGRPSLSSGALRPAGPAISVKFRSHATQSQSSRGGKDGSPDVEVAFEALHLFLDLGLVSGGDPQHGESATMSFLKEAATPSRSPLAQSTLPSPGYPYEGMMDDDDDADTPPSTPRAAIGFGARTAEEQQQERRRLEQLVLDDLDLEYDYRQGPKHSVDPATERVKDWRKVRTHRNRGRGPTMSMKFPAIRIQIRDTPPLSPPRSGALILDLHDLHISPGKPAEKDRPTTRFAPPEDPYLAGTGTGEPTTSEVDNALLYAQWHRLVVSYAPLSSSRATAILSLGPSRRPSEGTTEHMRFGGSISPDASVVDPVSRPSLQVRRGNVTLSHDPSTEVSSLVLAIDVPSIHIELSKPTLDGLQLWADDLTRLMEAAFGEPPVLDTGTERADSRDSSLIGSRFFAKSRSVSSQAESGSFASRPQETANETAIKITLGEGTVRLFVPRLQESPTTVRPFDVSLNDVDVLVELKPEGKDETVLTVGIRGITVSEITKSGSTASMLALTHPYSLLSAQASAVKVRFISLIVPETTAKESRVKLTLRGITFTAHPDFAWTSDLASFVKAPPGAFESVVPSERTRLSVKVVDTSLQTLCPTYRGALIPYIGELDFSTVIEGASPDLTFLLDIPAVSLFLVDDVKVMSQQLDSAKVGHPTARSPGAEYWKRAGFALLAELVDLKLRFARLTDAGPADTRISVSQGGLRVHLCADTLTALTAFISDFTSIFAPPPDIPSSPRKRSEPTRLSQTSDPRGLLSSLDEHAFRQLPEVGAAPDMIYDDLPTNPDYLDESFGAAAGLRELDDDEFDETNVDVPLGTGDVDDEGSNTSTYGGETVRMLRPEGLQIIEHYFDTMSPDSVDGDSSYGETTLRVRLQNFDITLLLYDGYDWMRTRRIIEEEQKEMRKKLAKIRQLVASGQTPDPSVEETSALLFNSVYIGLEHNIDELEPGALIAAIDEELNEDLETASQSSWQSLKPQTVHNSPGKGTAGQGRTRRKRMSRSKGPSIEFRLMGLNAEYDQYLTASDLVSRTLVIIEDIEILDHIKTSTWRKFLTSLRSDSRGNIRETGSDMVRVELRTLHPVPDHPSEEARLRAKILPLRLHVDQDALDFLKKFFSFKDPESVPAAPSDPEDEIYFQQAEVFPVDIKLDYKPRRVDYRALRDGRTIELMNFFHFDGAEMTLRHITLTGITGWPRFFDLLNDLWTPDVKATQLVDVISGVAPIRSVVNVGSGVADLVLLPIAQYKKDGRVVRGLQKGTTAFVKSTAMEAIKLGARLATGTQVILEQAENVIGGQFKDPITAETVPGSPFSDELGGQLGDEEESDLISRYAEQPMNVQEGMQSAYRSLSRNFNSAAQTILAVPMEVYERSGNEGPVRAVVRAVPIAVLKPMIGASEAVSKTLLGLHNQLDPNVRHENEAKYKQR